MAVEKCICSNISFEKIKRIAEQNGYTTVEQLREAGICSRHCRLCAPYLQKMLETGCVSFQPENYT